MKKHHCIMSLVTACLAVMTIPAVSPCLEVDVNEIRTKRVEFINYRAEGKKADPKSEVEEIGKTALPRRRCRRAGAVPHEIRHHTRRFQGRAGEILRRHLLHRQGREGRPYRHSPPHHDRVPHEQVRLFPGGRARDIALPVILQRGAPGRPGLLRREIQVRRHEKHQPPATPASPRSTGSGPAPRRCSSP